MFAFFSLLFVLFIIYFFTSSDESSNIQEGFNPMNTSPEHKINIPVNKIPPPVAPASCSNPLAVKPFNLPGELPVAPYEQIAAMSPLPYQDTTLIKANRQQLINQLEMMKGFLAFEAQELSERSDPTIQLPLNTARSDFFTLQAEVEVLNRNPGLQPTITLSHLNEISSNLAFLQNQVRLIGAAGPIQGPVYEFTQPVNVIGGSTEGFLNMAAVDMTPEDGEIGDVPSDKKLFKKANRDPMGKGLMEKGPMGKGQLDRGPRRLTQDSDPNVGSNGQIATPEELKNFVGNITGEVLRLSQSGTTDPLVQSRITTLTNVKNYIQDTLTQLESGALQSTDVTIMSKDIKSALPVLGKPSQPLPKIFQTLNLPPGLANALPSNPQHDPVVSRDINKLIDKYADTIVNGLSASFEVKYTSPREETMKQAEMIRSLSSTVEQSGFPSMADLDNVSNAKFTPMDYGVPITDRLAPTPMDAGRGPSSFNWKERAKQIEEQVRKRKLKREDFGIMPPNAKVSDEFSWKGYARMICTRLQATMDPSLPETCGCPPMDWKGWRIAK